MKYLIDLKNDLLAQFPALTGDKTGTTQWEYQAQEIVGINTSSSDDFTKFRAGTAYVAPLFIFNHGGASTGDVAKVSNLYFEKI